MVSDPRTIAPGAPVPETYPPPPPPPPRRGRRTALIVGALAILLVAAGLILFFLTRGSEGEGPKAPKQPATAGEEAPAAQSGPAIQLAAGTIRVAEAEVVDTFPPGCEMATDPTCQEASLGYEILAVWFEADGADLEAASDEIIELYGEAYVTDSTGARTDAFGGGMLSGRLMVTFTPEEGASGFTLHWPGTDPIDLGI